MPVPLPDIRLGPGPAYRRFSYYDYEPRVVWLLLTDWHSPGAFYHELGHCFDWTHLTDPQRDELQRLIAGKRFKRLRPWRWGRHNPVRWLLQPGEEFFADAYAECCMGSRPQLRRYLRGIVDGS